MITRLGVTGSRHGTSPKQKLVTRFVLSAVTKHRKDNYELHHGDCVGVDEEIFDLSREYNYRSIAHPPTNEKLRAYTCSDKILSPKDYLTRNKDIVNSSDLLLGIPNTYNEMRRSGTWATIRYALTIDKLVFVVYPDGSYDVSKNQNSKIIELLNLNSDEFLDLTKKLNSSTYGVLYRD